MSATTITVDFVRPLDLAVDPSGLPVREAVMLEEADRGPRAALLVQQIVTGSPGALGVPSRMNRPGGDGRPRSRPALQILGADAPAGPGQRPWVVGCRLPTPVGAAPSDQDWTAVVRGNRAWTAAVVRPLGTEELGADVRVHRTSGAPAAPPRHIARWRDDPGWAVVVEHVERWRAALGATLVVDLALEVHGRDPGALVVARREVPPPGWGSRDADRFVLLPFFGTWDPNADEVIHEVRLVRISEPDADDLPRLLATRRHAIRVADVDVDVTSPYPPRRFVRTPGVYELAADPAGDIVNG